jgi:outer membrane protein OmpA-like peptidoglycan-associated protein
MIGVMASVSSGCIASRKFVRNEVKTSSDTLADKLNGRIDENKGEISEVRDSVTRVDAKVTGVDGRVSQLDSRTTERFDGVTKEVAAVDRKVGTAQSSADRAASGVSVLDEKFQNRNQYAVASEKTILFKFDNSKLDAKYESELEGVASMLQQSPDAVVVLEGRTDSKGDMDYNVKLGERRVEAVKRYLAVELGVPVYRIHQISFGAAKPVAENDSREGREKNRAVILTILTPKAAGSMSSKNPQ